MSGRPLCGIRNLWPIAAALAVGLGLVGCSGGDQSDLEAYVAKIKARQPDPLEPLPDIKQVDTFIYEPGERRDPFVADSQAHEAVAAVSDNGLAPDPLRRKEELESFSLDALRMVGTLEQDQTRWALIRSQDGILYKVRVGNHMGLNNGQITSISDDEIQLTEVVSDGPGDWRERQAKVSLTE